MLRNQMAVGALALSVVLLGAAAASAAITVQSVRGKLTSSDDEADEKGKFKIRAAERGEESREGIRVRAVKLDATADDAGDLPVYDLWLVDSTGDTEADFGDLDLRESGRARFRFSSKTTSLPAGVDAIRDFGGGTIEIRDADGVVVISDDIPDFIGLDDENSEGSGAGARGRDKERLTRPIDAEGESKGAIKAHVANTPNGVFERLTVSVKGLASADGAYDVVAIDGDGDETVLGEIETVTRAGVGVLRLQERDDEDIPGGGIDVLAGFDVEVRNADGDVVLSGVYPTIE